MKLNLWELDFEAAEKVAPYSTIHLDQIDIPDDLWARLVAGGPPTPFEMAGSAMQSTAQWLAAGAPVVDELTYLSRSVECSLCWRWDARAQRCLECGCYAIKLRLATETCPLRRW